MGGLDALSWKNYYIKLKFSDQNEMVGAQMSLAREKRQGHVLNQALENDFKFDYNDLVQGYESTLNGLRSRLSTETDPKERENIQQQINQIQTEKNIALALLQDEKDATSEMYKAVADQKETYWTLIENNKKGDVELDTNMIKVFQEMWKNFCASITGGNNSSQNS